ncbi:PDZ domain-containing protein [Rothia sp. ZJ932]|uniref:YlbL family protein n=1 Tax=Rothia sp. ZJ932 TaxID=2810516 RepID=UPI001967287C|nr:S16 family serine protease [Rothia sp. ZJ932]QRZ62230.1 PDZ domain-containing protein [Rothia sp. ZJ932]
MTSSPRRRFFRASSVSSASASASQPRWTLARTCGAVTAILTLGSFAVPVKYVTEQPGPTFNTIGEYEGAQLIEIEGRESHPVTGNLDMTTVSVAGGPNTNITALYALANFFDASSTVLPSDLIYAPTVTHEEVTAQNTAEMTNSQEIAQAAALNYLGEDVNEKLVVNDLAPDSASKGLLEPGDVVVAVNGQRLNKYSELTEQVQASEGQKLSVTVERDGKERTVEVTPRFDEQSQNYLLGLMITRTYDFPFTVNYGLEEVGGPSAGLMFALGIIDELNKEEMTGGKHFAGTGTIDSDGTVGPIGGAPQKLVGAADAGATVFFLPHDNCADVTGKIPDGLTIIPVKTLDDAATALKDIGAGRASAQSFDACPAP